MKRINVHFDDEVISESDKILNKLKEGEYWGFRGLTRADLIRLGVSELFKIKYSYVHIQREHLLEKLKKLKLK